MISKLRNVSFSNLSSLQLFQLLRYGTFVLIGIGFAKLGVSLTQIGSFETFILLNGLLSAFWVGGIINTLLAVYPKETETQKRELLFNTFLSLVVFSGAGALLLFLFAGNLLSFLEKAGNAQLIPVAAVYLLLNTPCFITEYILFLHERKNGLLAYAAFSLVAMLLAALGPAYMGYDIIYSLYALVAVAISKLLVTALVLGKYATPVFNFSKQKNNLKLALPLMLSLLVSGSAEYIDGLIVKWKFDDMFFAIYRYGAKELPVLLIVSNTFSTAMIPTVAADLNKGLEEIKERSLKLMHLFFPLTIVLLLTSPWLYKIVFNESFAYSALIFNMYLLLIIPRVLFPQTILTGMGQTKFLLWSALVEMMINAGLSIYLAGKMGLPGVAVATFIAYLFDKLFLASVIYVHYKIPPSAYLNRLPYWLYTIATLLAFAVSYYFLKT